MTALLSAESLGLVRGDRRLFDSLSFALRAGELLHIQGHNGSGKTSLLKTIAGLIEPESGTVFWQGRSVRRIPQAYRRQLVWAGHKIGFSSDLTLLENLRFERALRAPASMSVSEVLERLKLRALRELPLRALSAGQQRRASLARLMLSDAPLWLIDEPFTNLDAEGRLLVGEVIAGHLAAGGLCVAASHQPLGAELPGRGLALS